MGRDQSGRGLGSRALIIQTIRRDPTGSDQIDAEHQATDLAVASDVPQLPSCPTADVAGLTGGPPRRTDGRRAGSFKN
jgi:hypothetical protein